MGLADHLESYDGASVSQLAGVQVQFRETPDFMDTLIDLCFDGRAKVSEGATWILKSEVDAGRSVSDAQLEQIAQSVSRLSSWQAQLHLLQTVEKLHFHEPQVSRVFAFAHKLRSHKRPFLRAWSLHVQIILALEFEEFRKDAFQGLNGAENDPSASVRARARQLNKRWSKAI